MLCFLNVYLILTSIYDFYSRIFTIKIHAHYDKCQGHNERSWTLFNVYKSQAAIGSNCFRKKCGPMKSCFTIPYKIIQDPVLFRQKVMEIAFSVTFLNFRHLVKNRTLNSVQKDMEKTKSMRTKKISSSIEIAKKTLNLQRFAKTSVLWVNISRKSKTATILSIYNVK